MATKRNTKAVKRGKKVKNLAVKSTQAKGVKGGSWIEVESFQWGVGRGVSIKKG